MGQVQVDQVFVILNEAQQVIQKMLSVIIQLLLLRLLYFIRVLRLGGRRGFGESFGGINGGLAWLKGGLFLLNLGDHEVVPAQIKVGEAAVTTQRI